MPELALYGAIFFTLALAFYSIGIWAEFFAKRLKPWHAVAFFLGVVTDTIGTGFMVEHVGGVLFNAHTVVGVIGLALMILHFLWAVAVLLRAHRAPGSPAVEHALRTFHRYSVAVWVIWMGAYLSGAWLGMQMG